MTNRETMELFIEKNGQETVAYPFVEKDHVVFGNGMGIEEVIEQDISMPTVTHEEVSFKVGVGDQDVSSSIVDSSVGEMYDFLLHSSVRKNTRQDDETVINKIYMHTRKGIIQRNSLISLAKSSLLLLSSSRIFSLSSLDAPLYSSIFLLQPSISLIILSI